MTLEEIESIDLDSLNEIELNNLLKIAQKHADHECWAIATNYNIQDVELIVNLDKKLDYISLIRFIAYNGLCGLEHAINTVPVITGAIAIKARGRGEYVPTFLKGQKKADKNAGGFVHETKAGFVENMITFDANSLYPSVMISLNISPETKLGRYEKVDDGIDIHHISGRTFRLTPEKFLEYLKVEKAAVSKSGHLYSQHKMGIMPEFLDNLYTKRKDMKYKGKSLEAEFAKNKSTMSEKEISEIKREIQKCDTFQNSYKIILNSAYGYTGNYYAHMADDDIANSVTLTGQAVNKKNKDLFMNYLIDEFGVSPEDAENSCIAGDTDSFEGDTLIQTEVGKKRADILWDEHYNEFTLFHSKNGHEIVPVQNLNILTYDTLQKELKYSKVKNLSRHKVSKRRFKIICDGKEIIMTEDHGLMVLRNEEFIRISPKDYKKGDKIMRVIEKNVSPD